MGKEQRNEKRKYNMVKGEKDFWREWNSNRETDVRGPKVRKVKSTLEMDKKKKVVKEQWKKAVTGGEKCLT